MTYNRSRISAFFSLSFFVCASLVAQNLVVNPSFEKYKVCPSNMSNLDALLEDVSLPTSSSGDYFNECGTGDFTTPANFKGSQTPGDGLGYAGLYFFALNDYREYLQMNTTKVFREKHPYKISLQVSLAETSTLALKNMSVVLTNKKIRLPNSAALTSSRLDLQEGIEFHEVQLKADKSLSETDGWITLTGEFDAKGFEQHILLGNFQNNEGTTLLNNKKTILPGDFSYYYIDNLVVEELPRINYEADKIYVLEQNPFEPKGYELDAEAIASVKKIFKFLKENADVQMKITGHSNDAGNPEYNKFVSSLRARAVALYLKKLGITDERIVWEGAGETKPLRNGKLKEGQFKKGQVEFVMTNFEDQ